MEKKKTKLTLSGNLKKSITNIERAKTQGKNSVLIEKKIINFLIKELLILHQNLHQPGLTHDNRSPLT